MMLWREQTRTSPVLPLLRIPVTGTSMVPTLRPGDRCWVRLGPLERCRVGEIVVVHSPRGWVVHRVVGRWGRWLVTRGDARVRPDGCVSVDALVGVVVAIERQGRYVSRYDAGGARFLYLLWTWCRALGLWLWARVRSR